MLDALLVHTLMPVCVLQCRLSFSHCLVCIATLKDVHREAVNLYKERYSNLLFLSGSCLAPSYDLKEY